jgi:hypothetical protein
VRPYRLLELSCSLMEEVTLSCSDSKRDVTTST